MYVAHGEGTRFIRHVFAALVLVLSFILSSVGVSASPPAPVVAEEQPITTTGEHKLPSPAAGNGRMYVAWSLPQAARFAERDESSGTFATSNLGTVGDNSTYFNATTAVSSDGTVHYAWIDAGRLVRHRSKAVGQGWSTEHVIAAFENFANSLAITARGNEVFLTWRHQGADPAGYVRVAYSHDNGVSWPIVRDVATPTGTYAGRPYLATNAKTNVVVLTWPGTDGNIYVGQWNGQTFANTCITCSAGARNDFFNPTIAVGPDGQAHIAWRSVARGVFYGSRQSSGTWSVNNVFPHREVVGPVAVAVDHQNNVHLAWISKQTGSYDAWYAVKTTTSAFSAPITISRDGGAFKTNLDMAVSTQPAYALAHIFYESFAGGQFIRYARVQSTGIGCSSNRAIQAVEQADMSATTKLTGQTDVRAAALTRRAYIPIALKPAVPPASC